MLFCIPHQSLMIRQSPQRVTVRRPTRLKSAVPSSPHDSQETARLSEDSQCSSLVDDRNSPTPPSQVIALTWQCDMWLHVAYGVYLVMLLIRVNCICLVNTLYLWIWYAFLFWYILHLSINHVLTSNYFSCVSLINAPNLLNCISLAYTLYMWIWHAFLFLVHTTSAYHTMFLHQTTVLVYPASIAYDETVTRVG